MWQRGLAMEGAVAFIIQEEMPSDIKEGSGLVTIVLVSHKNFLIMFCDASPTASALLSTHQLIHKVIKYI